MSNSSIRVAYGPKQLHFGDLYIPDGAGPFPTAILIHGGFWRKPYDLTLMTGLAADLARREIAAWNIEYRRVGDTDGGWPNTLLDVAQAADYVLTLGAHYPLDLDKVVTIGHSAGGQLALWLAARHRIPPDSVLAPPHTPFALAGAISQAGAVDLEMAWRMHLGNGAAAELLGGSPANVPDRYAAASPAALLPLGVPHVLVHGTTDDRVPYAVSEAYFAAAQAADDDVTLITLPGVDHFALIDPTTEAWTKTVAELHKLLS